MFDCQLALLENAIMRYTVEGEIPGPLGARHPTITPFQAFKTSDGAIIIAAGNDGLFVKTCEALGRPDIAAEADYKTNALRLKHHKKLEQAIELVLKGDTTAHWLAVLAKAGVPGGPINNIEQALEHPQVAARNMLIEVPDGSGGTLKLAGNPLKMSAFADPGDAAAGARSRQRPRVHPLLHRRLSVRQDRAPGRPPGCGRGQGPGGHGARGPGLPCRRLLPGARGPAALQRPRRGRRG